MLFPLGSLPPGPPIETKKALLLLDFQNDFVSPDGKLPVANVQPFLQNLISLVPQFRAKGEVIWIGTEFKQPRSTISSVTGSHSILLKQFIKEQDSNDEAGEYFNDPGYTRSPSEDPLSPSPTLDLTYDREAFLAPVSTPTRYRCCIPGSPGADYPDLIKAAIDSQQDRVLLKSHYSAFVDTPLLTDLRTRLVTELYVCGSLSNISVYSTVLDAVCHGLQVTIIEDCLGYNDETCHIEAMRQMADNMGANGVDCQELRDDLAGLLGDVVREEEYTTRFQVSLPPPARTTRSHTSRKRIDDWISTLENQGPPGDSADGEETSLKGSNEVAVGGRDFYPRSESSRRPAKPPSKEQSPPQKRSPKPLNQTQNKQPPRKRRPSHESSIRSTTPPTNTTTVRALSTEDSGMNNPVSSESDQVQGEDLVSETNRENLQLGPKKKKKLTANILGPNDKMGQGDCRLCIDVLGQKEADEAFHCCRKSVKWQKMYHRSGEVPRLVAVQGTISANGTQLPIYRHPADESPELLPFDSTVDLLRKVAEKAVGHPLNHVLIQWYRNSEDNISEHSDKTLDIVRGSGIVNLSLGAQRTMTLRTKKSAVTPNGDDPEADFTRPCQRIPLPHNSLFVLGQETNQHWLHAIRADKRLPSEKNPSELAFEGERISLTFRQIGTFINPIAGTIWGQGGTSKTREGAKKLLFGSEAEREGEAMIRAFGQENHRSIDWDWEEWYGKGFDVVNFETKKV
ncbi:uncharacterized protein Z518_09688 [Rhinocladiella mackenziei CBS 650.93]|uniref:Fe2OG dioxygenase domain-containing protein n=1 Tax=Rhinocladiella mackenziei CBS 650.93 TaxID=1442369 RepID=A0A0D2GQP9_9EURO|nr:uncharacterized protein Z518_09688 [Rhinocladiella mackenziei CBS 650.93]KIX00623.1 hypothetical protein Z518_09688 [Rhinocladiella mackenziei CBS 650.93]